MTQVFLNYRKSDDPFGVALLSTQLAKEFGADAIFLDANSIPLGASWEPVMFTAIENSAAMLVIMGRGWATATDEQGRRRLEDPRDFVRREILHAFELGKPVIPVRLGVPRPPVEELPAELRRLHACQDIEVRVHSEEVDLGRLAAKLREQIPDLRKASVTTTAAGNRFIVHNNHGQVFQGDHITFGDFHAGPLTGP